MFKQFLQLDLNSIHDKQAYSLKKNQLIIKQLNQSAKFDAIFYSSQDTASKILFQIITLVSKKSNQSHNITVTFNYNIETKDLVLLLQKILSIKIFSKNQFRLGHFQIRNGHISDYNKNNNKKVNNFFDDMDQFEKQIDNCLKLDRLWKINEYITYEELKQSKLNNEMVSSSRKFGKRTNQFFVLEIDRNIKVVLIILPRNREFVFTKQQQKEIQELYIINKHSSQSKKQNIYFNTPIAQIINNYIENSSLNLFISSYPQQKGKQLGQSLKLALRLGNPHQIEMKQILESYNKDKLIQLEYQSQKMKKKLKDLKYHIKAEQQNMQRLTKIYAKNFSKIASNIEYLKNKNIKNVGSYVLLLKNEIKKKQEEIECQEASLKQIHKQIIMDEERHLFYLNKIKSFKDNHIKISAASTPKSIKGKVQFCDTYKENIQPTQEELMYLYDPQKQLNRYREIKEQQLKNTILVSHQKRTFLKMFEDARFKISKIDFHKIEQQFYDLLSY